MEAEEVLCDLCGGEVENPGNGYCLACSRKICWDCTAAHNRKHGVRWCQECYAKEMNSNKKR